MQLSYKKCTSIQLFILLLVRYFRSELGATIRMRMSFPNQKFIVVATLRMVDHAWKYQ